MKSGAEIAFRFSQIEGNALRFSQAGNKEHEEADRLINDIQTSLCARTISTRLIDCASMTTPMTANPMGIS